MTTIKGIDVSHHNGPIDWKKVRESGINFAFIKSSEGTNFSDNRYEDNFEGAWKNRIHVAPYHFVSPRSNAKAQAAFFIRKLLRRPEEMLLTPVLDIEWDFKKVKNEATGQLQDRDMWLNIKRFDRITFIKDIITEIENAIGRKPIIYTAQGFWNEKIEPDNFPLNDYPLWVADYSKRVKPRMPRGWDTWTFWQNSDGAVLTQYPGKFFDFNIWNEASGNFSKLAREI